MVTITEQLSTLLLRDRLFSEAEVLKFNTEAKTAGLALDFYLEQKKLITDADLAKLRSEIFTIPLVSMHERVISKEILRIIPLEVAEHYQMLAFELNGIEVSVAVVNPSDLKAREAMEFIARGKGLKVNYNVTTPSDLDELMKQYQSVQGVAESITGGASSVRQVAKTEGNEETQVAPVSKIVSVIFKNAVEGGASDIHIEPTPQGTRVRYRVDGMLHTTLVLPPHLHSSIISRVKVLANLKIDETRLPQDGRIRLNIDSHEYDFRVSTLPLLEQEKVVMRILDVSRGPVPLEELGFAGRELEIIQRSIHAPYGLFLVVGPTGSGKSTTLFSVLKVLNQEGVNISTLEDPVEYFLPGVNQSQIHPEIGFTFASGLRSLLRQDPNVIMVGEIRDRETAELAIHAGLTGHLVLSTLHTNNAIGVVPRLLDMGAEPFLLASTLNVIVAQRLLRKICPDCKAPENIPIDLAKTLSHELKQFTPEQLKAYDVLEISEPPVFYKGVGCGKCGGTGKRGRVAMAEVIEITPSLRQIISAGAHVVEMQNSLATQGFLTLRQSGLLKALAGKVALEEVLVATKEGD